MAGCYLIALVCFLFAFFARWRCAPDSWYWGGGVSLGFVFLTLAQGWPAIKTLF